VIWGVRLRNLLTAADHSAATDGSALSVYRSRRARRVGESSPSTAQPPPLRTGDLSTGARRRGALALRDVLAALSDCVSSLTRRQEVSAVLPGASASRLLQSVRPPEAQIWAFRRPARRDRRTAPLHEPLPAGDWSSTDSGQPHGQRSRWALHARGDDIAALIFVPLVLLPGGATGLGPRPVPSHQGRSARPPTQRDLAGRAAD